MTENQRIYPNYTPKHSISQEVWRKRLDLIADFNYWQWFENWWDQDFSWRGLSAKPLNDDTANTLQTVWASEQNSLIEFGDGWYEEKNKKRLWTEYHLPLHDLYGNLSPKHPDSSSKNKWNAKQFSSFYSKLRTFVRGKRKKTINGPINLCFLNGIVFPQSGNGVFAIDKPEEYNYVSAEWCYFPANNSIPTTNFSNSSSFANSYFGRRSEFNGCIFGDSIDFRNCIFGASNRFNNSTFGDHANFSNASFSGKTDFLEFKFGNSLNFREAKFLDECVFRGIFKGLVTFDKTHFTYVARFTQSTFEGRTSFQKCKFLEGANFDKVSSSSLFTFEGAVFDGDFLFSEDNESKFRADFDNAEFRSLTNFAGSSLHPDSSFSNCVFAEPKRENAVESEKAYRSLYREFEQINDRSSALDVGRLILIAKLRQFPSKDVSFGTYTILTLYKLFSNFGQSLLRPIAGIAIISLLWSMIYNYILVPKSDICWAWEKGCNLATEGNLLSASLSVPPFSQLVATYISRINQVTDWIPANVELTLGLFAVSQLSLCALLIFLFGLAVRRRVLLN